MTTTTDAVKTLLIVDDSHVSRMLIRQHILAKCPNWVISEAKTGEESIEKIKANPPDYCTMDINMPGMLGTDAAEQILEISPETKVAIFSANIQDLYQQRAADLNIILVAKPVNEKSVKIVIDYLTGQTQ